MPFDLKNKKTLREVGQYKKKEKKTYDQWFGLSSKPVLT